MPRFETAELRAYLVLLLGFLVLVILLRSDLGRYLFDEDSLFYKLPVSVPKPSLRLEVMQWGGSPILRLHTENFVFADYCLPPQSGEPLLGHAHLYLNGRKQTSLYGPFIFLRDLPPGDHTLTVSLNVLPDHRAIMVDGLPVSTDLRLRLPAGEILP